jgi:hypothetical protein
MKLPITIFHQKIKSNFKSYLIQCSLATVVLFLILAVEGAHLSKAIVITAIRSTAFVLVVTPHSDIAFPRHVMGEY